MAKTYVDKNGKSYPKLPDPFYPGDGTSRSPMNDEKWISLGGVINDDGQPTGFETACAMFRQVCAAMGKFLGEPDFKGGFDEYTHFITSAAYAADPVTGNGLAIQWAGVNEYCKYEGSKIGLGQPDWWYECWKTQPNQVTQSSISANEESNESNDAEPAATEGE